MSTATSRKTKRVATFFTGAAATAVTFAPAAALAAPGQAQAQAHTALVNAKMQAMTPDVHSGSIRSKGCNTTDSHWLHIEYKSLFGRNLCKAFGFRGFMTVSQDMTAECGGNNYGTIFWNTGSLRYGPGNTYRDYFVKSLSGVSISHWNGTDDCNWPR